MHIATVAPIDYDSTTLDFNFDSGNTRRCANVTILNDGILEATEGFFVSLTTADPAVTIDPNMAQVDILEDPDDGKKWSLYCRSMHEAWLCTCSLSYTYSLVPRFSCTCYLSMYMRAWAGTFSHVIFILQELPLDLSSPCTPPLRGLTQVWSYVLL